MTKNRKLIVPAVLAAVVLLVLAVIYVAEPAKSLPSFFPGHEAGSTHHHVKHGIAAGLLAIGCLLVAWFQSGPSGDGPRASGA